jgi:hypothetical protein
MDSFTVSDGVDTFTVSDSETMTVTGTGGITVDTGAGTRTITIDGSGVSGGGTMSSFDVENEAGALQFTVTDGEEIRFIGSNAAVVSFISGAPQAVVITANSASDEKLKNKVTKLKNALDKTLKLNPVTYEWNKKALDIYPSYESGKKIGFIAQEVKKILPEFVQVYGASPDKSDPYFCVDYAPITALLTKSIQELNEKVESQEARIKKLEKLILSKNKSSEGRR